MAPLASILLRAGRGGLSANPIAEIMNELGLTALILLVTSLACTPPRPRPAGVLLRLAALPDLPPARPGRRSRRDRGRRRRSAVYHGRVRGAAAAHPARAHVDEGLGPPARLRALEPAAPPRLRGRRARGHPLLLARQDRPDAAAHVRPGPGGAARGASGRVALAARSRSRARSRAFRVSDAARASSARASSSRPSFRSRSPRTLGSRWYDFSDGSSFSRSTSSSPASGPNAIPTATARFSSTIGDGATSAS